jgi:hypothetical protein
MCNWVRSTCLRCAFIFNRAQSSQLHIRGEAGLLGNGVLSRFRVTVDSVAHRVILERP